MRRAAVDEVIGSSPPVRAHRRRREPARSPAVRDRARHTTLPPYLRLYSLDREENPAAGEALLSVFVEEMLHLALAANVLNAVGGRPRLDTPQMVPGYSRSLPHGDPSFAVSLLPFGGRRCGSSPRSSGRRPRGRRPQDDRYDTIGQFYEAIRHGLVELCAEIGEAALFCGDPARQVDESFTYGGSGRIIAVDGLERALAALDEIIEQGEGAADVGVWVRPRHVPSERDEVAHYYRIEELVLGRRYRRGDSSSSGPTGERIAVDWDGARPMRHDQRIADQPPGSRSATCRRRSTPATAPSWPGSTMRSTAGRTCSARPSARCTG